MNIIFKIGLFIIINVHISPFFWGGIPHIIIIFHSARITIQSHDRICVLAEFGAVELIHSLSGEFFIKIEVKKNTLTIGHLNLPHTAVLYIYLHCHILSALNIHFPDVRFEE